MEINEFFIEDSVLIEYKGDGGDVVIPDGITAIDDNVFENCCHLTSVTLPNSIKSIGDYAFYACENLASVIIPDSITSIPYYAFSGCTNLTSVTIGKGVKTIGRSAFEFCPSLRNVYYNGDIASWCSIDFDDYANPLRNEANLYIRTESGNFELVENLVIPDNITSIRYDAFKGCISLLKVTIGNGVKHIDDSAFAYSTLTDVIIGRGIEAIGTELALCNALTSITIENNITYIDGYAFSECFDLRSIFFKGTAFEFKKIVIGEIAARNIEEEVTVYYFSEDTPTEEGNFWHYVHGIPTIW